MSLLNKIILLLTKELENTRVDYYNENTYNFSQGYMKGLSKAIELLNHLEV